MLSPPIRVPTSAPPVPRVQRKCECRAPARAGGACPACAEKRPWLQPKLEIGAVNDPLEREADRTADAVLAGGAADFSRIPVTVQRHGQAGAPAAAEAPASVHRALAEPGRPLDAAARSYFEPRFGRDFSQVRIHDAAAADESARAVGAAAYTVANDIVFRPGRYAPASPAGRRLLAHELAHVAQQDAGTRLQRQHGPGEEEEEEFDINAAQERLDNSEYDPNTGRLYPPGGMAQALAVKAAKERPRIKFSKPEAVAEAASALGAWGSAHFEATARLRDWLSYNLFKFQGASDKAKKEAATGLQQQITKALTTQLVSWGVGKVAAKVAMSVLSAAFLAKKAATFLGGVFSAFVGLILDKVGGMIFNSDVDPVKTSEQYSMIVGAINKAVNSHEREKLAFAKDINDGIHAKEKTSEEISDIAISLYEGTENAGWICPDPTESSLYEKLMLTEEVYEEDKILLAENKPEESVGGTAGTIKFAIPRERTWNEPVRFVHSDKSIVVVEISSYHCATEKSDETTGSRNVPDGARVDPADYPYYVPSMFTVALIAGTDTKDPKYPERWFSVGEKQYGTWYNVGRGFYRVRITRELGHFQGNRSPVGLCGHGTFKAGKQ